jgi:hypothetical protein
MGTPFHVPLQRRTIISSFFEVLGPIVWSHQIGTWHWSALVVPISDRFNWRILQFFRLLVECTLGRSTNTFFCSWSDWLWKVGSPRIQASPPTLWTVLPTCRGLDWVCPKLKVISLRCNKAQISQS